MKNIINLLLILLIVSIVIMSCSDDETIVQYDSNKPILVNNIIPNVGGLGTSVIVKGSNFGTDKDKVELYFNETKSTIFNLNNETIYALVPKQPGDTSVIRVVIDGKEGILKNKKFKYKIKAVVTTVAGCGEQGSNNGSNALETQFGRVSMIDVDDKGNIVIVDDWNKEIKLLNLEENKIITVLNNTGEIWQGAFNADYTKWFGICRRSWDRPMLVRSLDTHTWFEEKYYDVENYLLSDDAYGLCTDDKDNVYIMAQKGAKFLRLNTTTKNVEVLGEDLEFDNWIHIAYNPIDHCVYASGEDTKTVYRIDPYDLPVTLDKIEIYAGDPAAGANYVDAIGKLARFGAIEGICCDNEGNIYVADYGNELIRKIDKYRNVTTVAGVPGESGFKDGAPDEALFNTPYDVAVDKDGLIYVADTYNRRIRCIAIQ